MGEHEENKHAHREKVKVKIPCGWGVWQNMALGFLVLFDVAIGTAFMYWFLKYGQL